MSKKKNVKGGKSAGGFQIEEPEECTQHSLLLLFLNCRI